MERFIKRLHYILDQKSITCFNERKEATLKENDPLNSYEILLKGLPENCIIVNTDKFKEQTSFFKNTNRKSIDGICKRADFAVVGSEQIVFIELKSGGFNDEEITQQFHGAQCVMDYCAAIGHRFFNEEPLINSYNNSYRFVLLKVKTPSIRTRHSPNKDNQKYPNPEKHGREPNDPRIILCSKTIHYSKLVK